MPRRKDPNAPYWHTLRKAEADMIEFALQNGVTLTKTARILGISVNYLSERIRTLGIDAPTRTKTPPAKVRKRREEAAAERARSAEAARKRSDLAVVDSDPRAVDSVASSAPVLTLVSSECVGENGDPGTQA